MHSSLITDRERQWRNQDTLQISLAQRASTDYLVARVPQLCLHPLCLLHHNQQAPVLEVLMLTSMWVLETGWMLTLMDVLIIQNIIFIGCG